MVHFCRWMISALRQLRTQTHLFVSSLDQGQVLQGRAMLAQWEVFYWRECLLSTVLMVQS